MNRERINGILLNVDGNFNSTYIVDRVVFMLIRFYCTEFSPTQNHFEIILVLLTAVKLPR